MFLSRRYHLDLPGLSYVALVEIQGIPDGPLPEEANAERRTQVARDIISLSAATTTVMVTQ